MIFGGVVAVGINVGVGVISWVFCAATVRATAVEMAESELAFPHAPSKAATMLNKARILRVLFLLIHFSFHVSDRDYTRNKVFTRFDK